MAQIRGIHANFKRAQRLRAKFPGAVLIYTNFAEADLTEAKLTGADPTDAALTNAQLSYADLSHVVGLTQVRLNSIMYDPDRPPKLPAGLNLPPQPAMAETSEPET